MRSLGALTLSFAEIWLAVINLERRTRLPSWTLTTSGSIWDRRCGPRLKWHWNRAWMRLLDLYSYL
jgi:hypothetical protein